MARTRLGRVDWSTFSPAPIIGVDEVGRGCLAGPVVAAAVVLDAPTRRRRFKDSKLLSAARRDDLYARIVSQHRWAVGFASCEEIDRVNIYHATLLAMRRAVQGLNLAGGHVLVDGKARIPDLLEHAQTTFIKGDLRCDPISAASIVAKVTRDRFMRELATRFPDYGFEIHKGYATKLHRRALARVGPCAFHRQSFTWAPVDDYERADSALEDGLLDDAAFDLPDDLDPAGLDPEGPAL